MTAPHPATTFRLCSLPTFASLRSSCCLLPNPFHRLDCLQRRRLGLVVPTVVVILVALAAGIQANAQATDESTDPLKAEITDKVRRKSYSRLGNRDINYWKILFSRPPNKRPA
eukprot:GHVT01033858.1.p2 GENE.GHVT01033858.1~~GHVT01033858.1.p2  ORF type:complete len:113 (+),score=16.06 GHVT01033858.1:761-1099(+)